MKQRPKKARLKPATGSALLCNNINITEAGRINLQGVITIFWAWGYPCNRSWWLVLTLFHLPKGKTQVTISLRRTGRREETSLLVVDTEADEDDTITTLPVQLSHSFEKGGRYELVCNVKNADRKLIVPFVVRDKEWVEFTNTEKEFVRNHPETPYTLRANVHCKVCSHAYIFEESVIDDQPSGGVHRFPASGEVDCEDCGHKLVLKDLQGQLRTSLKDMIAKAMGGIV